MFVLLSTIDMLKTCDINIAYGIKVLMKIGDLKRRFLVLKAKGPPGIHPYALLNEVNNAYFNWQSSTQNILVEGVFPANRLGYKEPTQIKYIF